MGDWRWATELTTLRAVDRVRRLGRDCRRVGLRLLFPPRCTNCDADLEGPSDDILLCDACRTALAPPAWHFCRHCGAAAPSGLAQPETCHRCANLRLHFDAVVSLGPYRDELRAAVLKMKRPFGEPLSAAMGELLILRHRASLDAFQSAAVLPIPMHWLRRLVREVNSPDVLAECLARRLALPLDSGLLVRRRNTLPQMRLLPKMRFRNLRGAISLRGPFALEGARVLLVDDILTTGATCSEVAKTLKQAGVAHVAVAVLARAEGEHA